ncbi:MAG TPA: VWA domain-containing protein [Bryobacteraceae bacterium]|nr:VWA domain-containing protein [Bryobacteraceae bacterium]HOQ45528.1 VWA domain-containing protein [Bryobacteraceae bacterium]HPU73434.1 VWA domain-containing protein [Bryobacteraceae bacterium]
MGRFGDRPMMTRRQVLASFAVACAARAAQDQETVFRVDVRLVRILATVKTNSGELVGNLQKEDFSIFDNGVPQEIAVFEHHTEQPLSIAILIDTSSSTGIELRYEVQSVTRFLRALFASGNPQDAVELYSFDADTTLLVPFTRRLDRLERELKGLKGSGGTSLYDAVCFAAESLQQREGRHVLVVITDGGDTTSAKTFHQALEAAQMADAVIYPILVMPITNDPGRNIGGENALTLMAQNTGGRVFAPSLGPALDQAFTEILRDLRTQYLIGYYPKDVPPSKDRFHRIQIKVNRPDLRVLARSGYYETSEENRGWKPVREE